VTNHWWQGLSDARSLVLLLFDQGYGKAAAAQVKSRGGPGRPTARHEHVKRMPHRQELQRPVDFDHGIAALHEESETAPKSDHVGRGFHAAVPGNVIVGSGGKDIIGARGGPPGQGSLKLAVIEVRLPRHGVLLGEIARLQLRPVEAERFHVWVLIASQKARFDTWEESTAAAVLQGGAGQSSAGRRCSGSAMKPLMMMRSSSIRRGKCHRSEL